MIQELTLKPEELFYLAKKNDGAYFDYDYIRMMPDIQLRKSVAKDEIEKSLEAKKIVLDSWGELVIDEEYSNYLKPIWDGEFEATVTIIDNVTDGASILYFHRLGDEKRLVYQAEDGLHILNADDTIEEATAYALLPDDYQERILPANRVIDGKVEKTIVLKNVKNQLGQATLLKFFEINDWMCVEDEGEKKIVSFDEFMVFASQVLKGE